MYPRSLDPFDKISYNIMDQDVLDMQYIEKIYSKYFDLFRNFDHKILGQIRIRFLHRSDPDPESLRPDPNLIRIKLINYKL